MRVIAKEHVVMQRKILMLSNTRIQIPIQSLTAGTPISFHSDTPTHSMRKILDIIFKFVIN